MGEVVASAHSASFSRFKDSALSTGIDSEEQAVADAGPAVQSTPRLTLWTENPVLTADAALRWPEWRFLTTDFHGVTTELLCPSKRTTLIDQEWVDQEAEEALAHQVAHLDLGRHEVYGRPYTDEDEEEAVWLANRRLDRIDADSFGVPAGQPERQ